MQDQAFQEELQKLSVLALYNIKQKTRISADSSSYGIGEVLLQKQSDNLWKLVAYTSRALTSTESHFVQVEKEALACTWATERFSDYVLGKHYFCTGD